MQPIKLADDMISCLLPYAFI